MSFVDKIIFRDGQTRAARPEYIQYLNLMLFVAFLFSLGFAKHYVESKDITRMTAAVASDVLEPELVRLKAELLKNFTPTKTIGDFRVEAAGNQIQLQFSTFDMFESGQASFGAGYETVVNDLARLVKKNYPVAQLEIEGFTDDTQLIKNKTVYPSNWELSSARAAAIGRVFEQVGFGMNQLKMTGRGPSMPMVANRDLKGQPIRENQARNRRAVIHIGKAL